MIRKLKSGEYRLYSRKVDPKTGKRRTPGTFEMREAAEKHEREVQYFKWHRPQHKFLFCSVSCAILNRSLPWR